MSRLVWLLAALGFPPEREMRRVIRLEIRPEHRADVEEWTRDEPDSLWGFAARADVPVVYAEGVPPDTVRVIATTDAGETVWDYR